MRKLFFLILICILSQPSYVFGQAKIILDSKTLGGFCNNYFDLNDYGFILVYNKSKDVDEGTDKNATLLNNILYYSKDLSTRANFKVTTNGQVSFYASKNYIFMIDRLSTVYSVKVFDFNGREINHRKFDIHDIGLTQDMIQKIHFTAKGELIFEVYDGYEELHLFKVNLLNNSSDLSEIPIAFPGSTPLQNMVYSGKWSFLGETSGFYILARKGSNAEFDPNAIAYHLAFYDEDFQLFRELLLDNFLLQGAQLLGKDATLKLNPANQTFVVSCLVQRGSNIGFMAACYGMSGESTVMTRFWHKEFALIDNAKYKLVENDGLSVPAPPVVRFKGSNIQVSVVKGRVNVNEESLNQLVVMDVQGNELMNSIQMGNFEMLNLDNYCVSNTDEYSRIKKLQMSAILKPYCEMPDCDVLDIDVDATGNELAIVRDMRKNQVTIYRYTARK